MWCVTGPPEDRVGWGVVSTGHIASTFATDLALLPDEASLVAVSSRSAERAQDFADRHGFARSYDSVEELAADEEVDVVYVASVHNDHLASARTCLAAGTAVLVEKPLTTSAADTAELIELAESTGTFLMEAVWTRVHPLIRKAAEVVTSGELGAVRHVSAGFGFLLDRPDSHRLLDPALAGGTILDMGVYPVHAVNLFLGEPAEVSGYAGWRRTGVEGHAAALLSYPATKQRPTATAAVISTFEVALPGALEVHCTDGRIMIEEFFLRPERMTIHRSGAEPEELVAQWPGQGYTFEAQEVMRCLRAGERQSPLVPWRDTLAVAGVLDRWRAAIGEPERAQP